jgi:hypothetical protein
LLAKALAGGAHLARDRAAPFHCRQDIDRTIWPTDCAGRVDELPNEPLDIAVLTPRGCRSEDIVTQHRCPASSSLAQIDFA